MTEQDPTASGPATGPPSASPYPSYPTGGIQQHDRRETPPSKTKAGWALGLAIVPALLTWIVSIILAIQVLSDSKHGRDHGKRMAIAALIIIPVWILIIVSLVVASTVGDADRDETGQVTDAGKVGVTQVEIGDCISDDDLAGEENTSINLVPCSKPHKFEAYATFTLTEADYPGEDEVFSQADDRCADEFASYIGAGFDDSDLGVTYLYPLKESWDLNSDVTCLVSDGTTTGSLEGAKR